MYLQLAVTIIELQLTVTILCLQLTVTILYLQLTLTMLCFLLTVTWNLCIWLLTMTCNSNLCVGVFFPSYGHEAWEWWGAWAGCSLHGWLSLYCWRPTTGRGKQHLLDQHPFSIPLVNDLNEAIICHFNGSDKTHMFIISGRKSVVSRWAWGGSPHPSTPQWTGSSSKQWWHIW